MTEGAEANTVEPTFALKLMCEFIGTFGLSYTVAMTAASSTEAESSLAPVAVPVCAACYLILMVYGIGSVSGCHINPGVSTAVFGWQCISNTNPDWGIEFVAYVCTQTLGGIFGAVVGTYFWINCDRYSTMSFYGVYPYRAPNQKPVISMVTEMIALFFFSFAILRTCCDHDKPPMCTDGLVIGIALFTAIVGTAQVSGGGVNPAVATSLVVSNYYIDDEFATESLHWSHGTLALVYWLGPMLGGALAAGVHYIFEASTSRVFVRYALGHQDSKKKPEE
jgi:aquaporin Z